MTRNVEVGGWRLSEIWWPRVPYRHGLFWLLVIETDLVNMCVKFEHKTRITHIDCRTPVFIPFLLLLLLLFSWMELAGSGFGLSLDHSLVRWLCTQNKAKNQKSTQKSVSKRPRQSSSRNSHNSSSSSISWCWCWVESAENKKNSNVYSTYTQTAPQWDEDKSSCITDNACSMPNHERNHSKMPSVCVRVRAYNSFFLCCLINGSW